LSSLSSSRSPAPATDAQTSARLIDQSITILRREWREGWTGRRLPEATRLLKQAQGAATSHELAMGLARTEAQLASYQELSVDARQQLLIEIAGALKDLLAAARHSELAIGTESSKPALSNPEIAPDQRLKRSVTVRPLSPEASIDSLPKIGPSVGKRLAKLGIESVGDMLRTAPRYHIDYSKTVTIREAVGFGQTGEVTVRGKIADISSFPGPPPRVTVRLADRTGAVRITWFNPYIAKQLAVGDEIAISGSFEHGYGNPTVTNPEWERVGSDGLSTGRLTPVYNLTNGVAQKTMRSLARAALDATKTTLQDFLPPEIRSEHTLIGLIEAYEYSHFPPDAHRQEAAQRRLAFDEFFLLQLGMTRIRRNRAGAGAPVIDVDSQRIDAFLASLPFRLTDGQQRALSEVLADLQGPTPMARLLQGDVGSGKTVVAAAAIYIAFLNGYQAAVMAPTEILAEQHFQNLSTLFAKFSEQDRPTVSLLTGSTKARERREILERLEKGKLDLIIGTHALIQQQVDIPRLGLAVIDEQHRFGVRQRADLPGRSASQQPHLLSMTATPIPRTLNLVLNGDLDVSVISELPPGRVPISTIRVPSIERERAYDLVRQEVGAGRQVFVICPLVEESEASDAKAAVAEAERLQTEVFPELHVSVLHGRMNAKDKDRIMTAFRDRESHILVSTSVIEVGIDIPNATVMLIEGADRFGLAQLHQFRGRVGRGAHQSYCVLLADDPSNDAEKRLDMMVQSNDGFALAEKDLELRGPGDFIGVRQSGLPEMAAAIRGFDVRLLTDARRSAEALLDRDPFLSDPQLAPLRDRAIEFWQRAALDLTFS
jgi:ATP-dependent DNA helicase RecG